MKRSLGSKFNLFSSIFLYFRFFTLLFKATRLYNTDMTKNTNIKNSLSHLKGVLCQKSSSSGCFYSSTDKLNVLIYQIELFSNQSDCDRLSERLHYPVSKMVVQRLNRNRVTFTKRHNLVHYVQSARAGLVTQSQALPGECNVSESAFFLKLRFFPGDGTVLEVINPYSLLNMSVRLSLRPGLTSDTKKSMVCCSGKQLTKMIGHASSLLQRLNNIKQFTTQLAVMVSRVANSFKIKYLSFFKFVSLV